MLSSNIALASFLDQALGWIMVFRHGPWPQTVTPSHHISTRARGRIVDMEDENTSVHVLNMVAAVSGS